MTKPYPQEIMRPAEFTKRAIEIAHVSNPDVRYALSVALMIECLYRNGFGEGTDILGLAIGVDVEAARREG